MTAAPAWAADCPVSPPAQFTVGNGTPGSVGGHKGAYSEIQRIPHTFSTPGCDYNSGLSVVETTHFALGSTVGANQIEDGFFQYRDGSNHIWYSMFTEYQIGTVVPDFHMYDAPGHVRPGNGTAPCNESADFGYTTFKLMLNGGNQQAGYNYRMIVDCQDGGGQRDLPQLTAVGWKVGLDMSEFEKGKTGIDEIGYVKNLFGQRASDGGWEGWGSVVCYGFSSTMSSHPNQLTSNSYNITLGGNRC